MAKLTNVVCDFQVFSLRNIRYLRNDIESMDLAMITIAKLLWKSMSYPKDTNHAPNASIDLHFWLGRSCTAAGLPCPGCGVTGFHCPERGILGFPCPGCAACFTSTVLRRRTIVRLYKSNEIDSPAGVAADLELMHELYPSSSLTWVER